MFLLIRTFTRERERNIFIDIINKDGQTYSKILESRSENGVNRNKVTEKKTMRFNLETNIF